MSDPLDPVSVNAQLAAPPFVVVEGVTNIRSLGNYPSSLGCITKPHFAFRCAQMSEITPTGKKQLQILGIKKIFDLRSDVELVKFGSPSPDLPGVEFQRIPVFKDDDYSPQSLTMRSKLYTSGKVEAMLQVYSDVLHGGALAFRTVFEHIRDRPHDGFLFHCTAGKDRTGVLSALILKAAGVNDEGIAQDYELTSVGLEPQRAVTEAKFLSLPDFAGNLEAVRNALSCRREYIISFINLLEEKGGIVEYLQRQLGFSPADIAIIRSNLLLGSDD